MKFSQLNRRMELFAVTLMLTGMIVSCNNSNKSEKKSTSSESVSDTMGKTDTTKAKRIGRVGLSAAKTNEPKAKPGVDKEGIYTYTDESPMYPGGQSSLESYISDKIEYPEDALDNSIEGTVNVRFTIDDKGNVGNVKAENSNLGHGLEEAAVKAVSAMPAWTPGKVKGKNVKAWYTLPVTFRIEG